VRAALYVPKAARWKLISSGNHNINEGYPKPALQALESQNPKLEGLFDQLDFNRIGGSGTAAAAKLADQRLKLSVSDGMDGAHSPARVSAPVHPLVHPRQRKSP
jgi:type I restriction enzyme M protein